MGGLCFCANIPILYEICEKEKRAKNALKGGIGANLKKRTPKSPINLLTFWGNGFIIRPTKKINAILYFIDNKAYVSLKDDYDKKINRNKGK